ncbi:uncharacterized protein LOC120105490 [Phoenix dactylifera]|uniref:Uncharacterized protein LOC103713901 n=1 Tax=Phoenix dactylifera TaxID=42345 RepID=A0A8B8ZKW5_PHODC|nr:uncharacterized protein LOC103713901 [Phoenix dactylifera]XP_038973957.1 uncharacterized protein LOC120105490 [Phoenix dactylifera]
MKASIRFREDQKPLVRAKIPISILGLPFLSGVSAGESRELRLDLATAFDYGPCFRVSYRPYDSWNPFSLVVKTGIGAFGSPCGVPMAMTAEFNLLGAGAVAGAPTFSIIFKPRLGDFSIKKTTGSAVIAPPVGRKIALDADREGSVDGVETPVIGFRPENGSHIGKKVNGFLTDFTAGGGGIQGLLSSAEISARSVLPLRSRAAVRFRWGLRMPPELRAAYAEDAGWGRVPAGGISLSKLPLLVMNKISIEHVALDVGKSKEKDAVAGGDVAEACLSVRRQLETLQAENGLLRKAVEELRAEIGSGKVAPVAGGQVSGSADVGKGGNKAAAGKRDRRTDGMSQESSGKVAADEVSEELKKALMGAGKI